MTYPVTNGISLILLFQPALTIGLLEMLYPPEEFIYRNKTYRDGHGAGSVFLDWLITSGDELIGIQLDIHLLGLNAYGRSKLTEEAQKQRLLEAERNFGRSYIEREEHHVRVWFGGQRDFDPERSCDQYLLDCNYVNDEG